MHHGYILTVLSIYTLILHVGQLYVKTCFIKLFGGLAAMMKRDFLFYIQTTSSSIWVNTASPLNS